MFHCVNFKITLINQSRDTIEHMEGCLKEQSLCCERPTLKKMYSKKCAWVSVSQWMIQMCPSSVEESIYWVMDHHVI